MANRRVITRRLATYYNVMQQGKSMNEKNNDGLDLAGLGKLAKAIPKEVYTQSTELVVQTFNKLTAPITETTEGLSRYIKQKFDNMVDAEKAVATYTIQNAISKAEKHAEKHGTKLISPVHEKSFIKTLGEASQETEPTLHLMWENLLADQLNNINFHPHFVEILPHFSPKEAHLLMSLLSKEEIGDNEGGYMSYSDDSFEHWVRQSGDTELNKWDYSCILLHEFKFADIIAPIQKQYNPEDKVTMLYRTKAGNTFLSAVSEKT